MGWLKIQKREYLKNGRLFCASDDTFWELIVFLAEITFFRVMDQVSFNIDLSQ